MTRSVWFVERNIGLFRLRPCLVPQSSKLLPHGICRDLHLQESTISDRTSVTSVVCQASSHWAANRELEKLWKVVEERIQNYGNYKVPRGVVEPG